MPIFNPYPDPAQSKPLATSLSDPFMGVDYLSTSSACDCTGLIPGIAGSEEEIDNYLDLYPYLPPEVKVSDISRE